MVNVDRIKALAKTKGLTLPTAEARGFLFDNDNSLSIHKLSPCVPRFSALDPMS